MHKQMTPESSSDSAVRSADSAPESSFSPRESGDMSHRSAVSGAPRSRGATESIQRPRQTVHILDPSKTESEDSTRERSQRRKSSHQLGSALESARTDSDNLPKAEKKVVEGGRTSAPRYKP